MERKIFDPHYVELDEVFGEFGEKTLFELVLSDSELLKL